MLGGFRVDIVGWGGCGASVKFLSSFCAKSLEHKDQTET